MDTTEIRRTIVAGIQNERPTGWQRMSIAGGAPWLARWLTASERVQFCRELERMAREGLVERIGRTGTDAERAARPTPAPTATARATGLSEGA